MCYCAQLMTAYSLNLSFLFFVWRLCECCGCALLHDDVQLATNETKAWIIYIWLVVEFFTTGCVVYLEGIRIFTRPAALWYLWLGEEGEASYFEGRLSRFPSPLCWWWCVCFCSTVHRVTQWQSIILMHCGWSTSYRLRPPSMPACKALHCCSTQCKQCMV